MTTLFCHHPTDSPETIASRSLRTSLIKSKCRPAPYHPRSQRVNDPRCQYALPHSPVNPASLTASRTQAPTLLRAPVQEVPQRSTPSSSFTSNPDPPPLVFSPEYIEAVLTKQDHQRHLHQSGYLTPHPALDYAHHGLHRTKSDSRLSGHLSDLPHPIVASSAPPHRSQFPGSSATTVAHSIDFPPSAQTTLVGSVPVHRHSRFVPSDDACYHSGPDVLGCQPSKVPDDKHKHKYAMELIDTALAIINKIWPETVEVPSPSLNSPSACSSGVQMTAPGPVRQVLQQATPESSPASRSVLGTKRKRVDVDSIVASKRRAVLPSDPAISHLPTAVPCPPIHPTASVSHDSKAGCTSPTTSPPITLRVFVRELLRRSKTHCSTLEVALCYLDGIEETVKRLKDCYRLGMAFGSVAMWEKGLYEEGMKDERRVVTLQEAISEADVHHLEDTPAWTPISPESDADGAQSSARSPLSPSAPVQALPANILASHPLLDPRRSFLAALVIATKFLQDRAYSNKAWAKLSGLPAQEIGRCERALGGALGWRMWVGKEGRPSASSYCDTEDMVEGGSVGADGKSDDDCVHGLNDPLAESFIAAAAAARAQQDTDLFAGSMTVAAADAPMLGVVGGVAGGLDHVNSGRLPSSVASTVSTSFTTSGPHGPLSAPAWIDAFPGSALSSAPWTPLGPSDATSQSLTESLAIITSMLDGIETKGSKSEPTFEDSQSTVVEPAVESSQITITSPPPSACSVLRKTTPALPMCGSFLHASPLQMDMSVAPFPFTFTVVPPPTQDRRSTLSPQQTLVAAPSHLSVCTTADKLSPFSLAVLAGGGGSQDSTPHATFSSPEYCRPFQTSFSPEELDTPPPPPFYFHVSNKAVGPDRSATLVDAASIFLTHQHYAAAGAGHYFRDEHDPFVTERHRIRTTDSSSL